MRVRSFFAGIDRLAGRFNKWFGATAVAAHAEGPGAAGGPPTLDPQAAKAVLGELERQERADEKET